MWLGEGWSWALGDGLGGGIAVTNLEFLRQTVAQVLGSETQKVLPRLVTGSLLRLIGIVLYLVLKFLPVYVIDDTGPRGIIFHLLDR